MRFQPGSSFGIQDDRRNGVLRLALRGELDLATAPTLEGHLVQVEQDGDGVDSVLLDLRDLTFVDFNGTAHTSEGTEPCRRQRTSLRVGRRE